MPSRRTRRTRRRESSTGPARRRPGRVQPGTALGFLLTREAAILEANHTRLRPILMTTVMLIAAMAPIALGQGPGAGARASMAKVIIGGQMLSLLLALLVTPVTYSLFDSLGAFLRRLGGWTQPPQADAAILSPGAASREV